MPNCPDSERAAFLQDWHVPYHDKKAIAVAFDFLSWFRPDVIFLPGDLFDFYAVSRYDKDPGRLLGMQDELDTGKGLLAALRKRLRKARIVFIGGNHEARLTRYLWQHPEISSLSALAMPRLLDLDGLDIAYHPYGSQIKWHGLTVEHGNLVRKRSGATAAGMLDSRGVSGLSGHTHRVGSHYRTDLNGTDVWYENGCLCNVKPEYVHGVADWQQCLSVAHSIEGRRRFSLTQVPVLSGRIYYAGKLWAA